MLVAGLTIAGAGDEARASANGLIDAAEAAHNPWAFANALYASASPLAILIRPRAGSLCAGAW